MATTSRPWVPESTSVRECVQFGLQRHHELSEVWNQVRLGDHGDGQRPGVGHRDEVDRDVCRTRPPTPRARRCGRGRASRRPRTTMCAGHGPSSRAWTATRPFAPRVGREHRPGWRGHRIGCWRAVSPVTLRTAWARRHVPRRRAGRDRPARRYRPTSTWCRTKTCAVPPLASPVTSVAVRSGLVNGNGAVTTVARNVSGSCSSPGVGQPGSRRCCGAL